MGPTLKAPKFPTNYKRVESDEAQLRRRRKMSSTQRHYQTYWCHECDMSVHLLTAAVDTTPFCPHCQSLRLELMDDLTPTSTDTSSFFLDSPSFRRFFLPFFADIDPPDEDHITIDSIIPTIKITSSFLEDDPVLLCAVCKDQFVIDDDAKLLPCNHLFHPDCILPWLHSNHNSCPLCRFQLPTTSKIETLAVTESGSSSSLSSPSHVAAEVGEPLCFSRIAMEMGFTHQDTDDCGFPDVGVLSNYLPSHF